MVKLINRSYFLMMSSSDSLQIKALYAIFPYFLIIINNSLGIFKISIYLPPWSEWIDFTFLCAI